MQAFQSSLNSAGACVWVGRGARPRAARRVRVCSMCGVGCRPSRARSTSQVGAAAGGQLCVCRGWGCGCVLRQGLAGQERRGRTRLAAASTFGDGDSAAHVQNCWLHSQRPWTCRQHAMCAPHLAAAILPAGLSLVLQCFATGLLVTASLATDHVGHAIEDGIQVGACWLCVCTCVCACRCVGVRLVCMHWPCACIRLHAASTRQQRRKQRCRVAECYTRPSRPARGRL